MKDKTVKGEVIEALPNTMYKVDISTGAFGGTASPLELAEANIKICYLGGKMKHNSIRVVVGDRVEVILDPYGGKATNRIVRRL